MNKQKTKRPALGRGLSALVSTRAVELNQTKTETTASLKLAANAGDFYSETEQTIEKRPRITVISEESNNSSTKFVPTNSLRALANQPRKIFKQEELDELANSIKEFGVLQPILVRKTADLEYEIIAGERRWRAAKLAEIVEVPVIIKDIDDRQTLEIALVENIQRSNLSPIEEAKAYQALLDDFNLSQDALAKRVGKNRVSIANCMRLLKLTPKVLEQVDAGELSMGHARAILTIKEPSVQEDLANRCINEGLSVREIEAIVARDVNLAPEKKLKTKKVADVGSEADTFSHITDELRQILGTKILIKHDDKLGSGKIIIQYYSEPELQRLVEIMKR